jgi:CRP-like cAMP-binding protein
MAELNLVEKVIALEGVDLLGSLSPEHLASIAAVATEVRVPPGRVILEAAKPVEALYIVIDGSVELVRDGAILDTTGQNAVLGAWALFDDEDPIPLTARAMSDTHLLRVGRDDFYDLLADNGDITTSVDVVISDCQVAQTNGLQLLKRLKEIQPEASRVLLTGCIDVTIAVEAINDVALFQYLAKPCDDEQLLLAVRSAAERSRLLRELREKIEQLDSAHTTLKSAQHRLIHAFL